MVQPTSDSLSVPSDPYATHLPVLQAIGAKLPIKRVLELGCGPYSTPTFLDVNVYPELEVLTAVEGYANYREWARQVFDEDKRLTILSVEGFRLHQTTGYDLILVDNGRSKFERIQAIKLVSGLYPEDVLVIIHDFEQDEYQQAADFDWVEIYKELTPWTAACWNGDPERFTELMP